MKPGRKAHLFQTNQPAGGDREFQLGAIFEKIGCPELTMLRDVFPPNDHDSGSTHDSVCFGGGGGVK